jgi:serine protease Do
MASALLDDLHSAISDATNAVADAVVTVGRGSGVVVATGTVLTNAHNLSGSEARIHFADGRTATGTVTGADLDGDLAAIAVDTGDVSPVELAADDAALGRPVIALARPRHRGLVATFGTVAAVNARFRGPRGQLVSGAFEHDARLPRWASGGPVVTPEGRLLGIDTHRRGDGFYVAIAATADLADRIDGLREGRVPPRPRLGIAVAPPHVARRLRSAVGLEERDGVLIREVEPDGPAAQAGLAEGDLVVSAGGQPVASIDDLHEALRGAAAGTIVLGVVRGATEREVTVTVIEPEDA